MSSPLRTPDRPFGTPAPSGRNSSGRPTRSGLVTGLVSLPVTVLFFPIGLLMGVIAVVTSIRALRKGGPNVVGRAVVGLLTGAASSVLAILCIVFIALLWPQYQEYSSCQSTAVTIAEKSTCETTFRTDIERRFGLPAGSVSHVP